MSSKWLLSIEAAWQKKTLWFEPKRLTANKLKYFPCSLSSWRYQKTACYKIILENRIQQEYNKTITNVVCLKVRIADVFWGNIQGSVHCGATMWTHNNGIPSHNHKCIQNTKCICSNFKMYLSTLHNVFVFDTATIMAFPCTHTCIPDTVHTSAAGPPQKW